MGFKKMSSRSLDFADFALSSSLEANRSVKLVEKIDAAINWSRVEAVLMQHYNACPVKYRDLRLAAPFQ